MTPELTGEALEQWKLLSALVAEDILAQIESHRNDKTDLAVNQ